MKIGVDIGGTFMDFCAFDTESQTLHSLKVLTTPDNPGRELQTGLDLLRDRYSVAPDDVTSFVHGTTVGINTIIQRKGSKLALITNAGFEDVIELARLRMPQVYSLFCHRPDQLIPKDQIFGVSGRLNAKGHEVEPLDLAALSKVAEIIGESDVDGVIISFLHAYRNAAHERQAREIVEIALPDRFVFTASEVWPVIREYERTTTAILNGYVHPRVSRYLQALEGTLSRNNVPARPLLTKSNGGVMTVATGRRNCVSMLLSGTASGVMGAAYLAAQAGIKNVLTLDIGGTSADLALIIDGAAQFGTGEAIGEFPLYVPSVSVTSIGAGGGSIAWVDEFGVLKVGPESAGSTPGPACYGRGGELPTVTDAAALCGWVGQAQFAFDQLSIERDLARVAIAPLAEKMGCSAEETAAAIIEIAVSEMFVEVNKLLARYGVDERNFTLMPFGGAGPMLGCFLAREVGMQRILIPHRPGVVSALGGLVADLKGDFIQTVFQELTPAVLPKLRMDMAQLQTDADHWLRVDQSYDGAAVSQFSADMRYHGQSHEIEVPLESCWITEGNLGAMTAAFHRDHERLYGFSDDSSAVQVINLRLIISGPTERPELATQETAVGPASAERQIDVWLDGGRQSVALYNRAKLLPGQAFQSPAVLYQDDTTICIPAGYRATIDAMQNLLLVSVEQGS